MLQEWDCIDHQDYIELIIQAVTDGAENPSDKIKNSNMQKSPSVYEPSTEIVWNQRELNRAKNTIRAVIHPLRRRMIDVIKEVGPVSVTSLYIRMRMDQSVCSQHLAILRRAEVIDCKRVGKNIEYTVNYDRIEKIQNVIALL